MPYADDPAGFERILLSLLAEHAPPLRERVDEREFGVTGPLDVAQGVVTPTVRRGWAEVADGRYAMAVGDAWVYNDPVTGQGANLASRCAFTLAEAVAEGPPYDREFCRRAGRRLWRDAEPIVEWTNAALGPPPPHVVDILAAATADGRVADEFIDRFDAPARMWDLLRSPDATAAWLGGFARTG